MRPLLAIIVIVALVLIGCSTTTKDIYFPGGQIQIKNHSIIKNCIPLTISPDGTLMAGMWKGTENLAVWKVDSGDLVCSLQGASGKTIPVLFSMDNKYVIIVEDVDDGMSVSRFDIEKKSIANIKTIEEARGEFGYYNASFTLRVISKGVIVSQTGAIIDARADTKYFYFDPYGAAWYRAGDSWRVVSVDGKLRTESKRPPSLVIEQGKERGSMVLVESRTELRRNGSTAYLCTVWLDHKNANPSPKKLEIRSGSLHVYSGVDVLDCAFVPRRNLIVLATLEGVALVPYEIEKRE